MLNDINTYIRKLKSRQPRKNIKTFSADQFELAIATYGFYAEQDWTRCAALTESALVQRTDWDDPTIKASIEYAKQWWMEAFGY